MILFIHLPCSLVLCPSANWLASQSARSLPTIRLPNCLGLVCPTPQVVTTGHVNVDVNHSSKMASPDVLSQHPPYLHTFSRSHTDTQTYTHNHVHTYVNPSLLYPSAAPSSDNQTYSRDDNTRLRVMTSHERDMGLRMEMPPLSKSISPSLSVRTFVTAVEVVERECEGDMSPVEKDCPGEEVVGNGLEETERLVRDLSIEDKKNLKSDKKDHRSQRRRKGSKTTSSKPGSKQSSRPGSRQNSDAQPKSTSRRGSAFSQLPPTIPQRTSSRTISPTRRATLLSFHHNSKNLFQSIGAALEDPKEAPSAISALLRHRASLSSEKGQERRGRSYSTLDADPYSGDGTGESPLLPQSLLNDDYAEEGDDVAGSRKAKPIPATIIDWTHPNTRRREYEKIDRDHSGVRGLWKKVTPQWCQGKGGRIPFYTGDEKDSDGGSVRRYRIEDEDEDVGQVKEGRKWNCLAFIGKG
jgi:hypothetical protein